jgi:parallel beta-helix repeat protein
MLYFGTSNCLVVDNIFDRTGQGIVLEGATGNAIIYNYTPRLGRASRTWLAEGAISNHGPHGIMNLFEGNIFQKFQNDGYHGSTSHDTLFRNQLHGIDAGGMEFERRIVNLCRGSYYASLVGNIIGDSSWKPAVYEFNGSQGHSPTDGSIYALGYPNGSGAGTVPEAFEFENYNGVYPDPHVRATIIRHGNYDYYHKEVVWDSAITSRTLPASLFYSSKPPFFGSLQWPPIGPDVNGLVIRIPAKVRWDAFMDSGRLEALFRE